MTEYRVTFGTREEATFDVSTLKENFEDEWADSLENGEDEIEFVERLFLEYGWQYMTDLEYEIEFRSDSPYLEVEKL